MSDASSTSILLPRPNVFVERRQEQPLDQWVERLLAKSSSALSGIRKRRALAFARDVDKISPQYRDKSEAELTKACEEMRRKLRNAPMDRNVLLPAFALVREYAKRTTGYEPFIVQLAAGYGMYCGGAVEMDTGEGKTLSAFLPASVHGLAGRAVHLVAANDYLAVRDEAELHEAYASLGLSSASIGDDMEPHERREVYRNDVVYVSNKEVAFDYLRDRLAQTRQRGDANISTKMAALLKPQDQRQPVMRGLDVGIVDEVDSVLVDDAGTPLLISTESGDDSVSVAADALELVTKLTENVDYTLDQVVSSVYLTEEGKERIKDLTEGRTGPWRQRVRREELMTQALSALNLFNRDEHYLVRDDKIVIVDSNTGRPMPDRFWGQGLHQMVELKEGCSGTGDKRPLINTTYQRFFRRYKLLAGTSGTIGEVSFELAAVYRLKPARIPRRQINIRVDHARRVFADRPQLWADVAKEVHIRRDRGQPVLIGVRSVDDAEQAAQAFAEAGLYPEVLSAAQDAQEAEIIAKAGQAGAITIATNMAGRGTDIRLGEGVREAGGLAVFVCERHSSRRVDRQLIGRCARQGDPGESIEFVTSTDMLISGISGWRGKLVSAAVRMPKLSGRALQYAQDLREKEAQRRRRRLVESDKRMAEFLAFTGGLE